MPVYNADKYLGLAIESILNQSYRNFEFLIFNDGSSDDSEKIITQYTDPRLKYYHYSVNQGYIKHLNYGINIAQGKYIARMDADDISLQKRFECQIEFLERNSHVSVCGTNLVSIDEHGNKISSQWFSNEVPIEWSMIWDNPLAHPSVMIRKSILGQYSYQYSSEKMPAEDYDLWSKILFNSKLDRLNETLLYYRVLSSSVSSLSRQRALNISVEISEKIAAQITGKPVPPFHKKLTSFYLQKDDNIICEPHKLLGWMNSLAECSCELFKLGDTEVKAIQQDISRLVFNYIFHKTQLSKYKKLFLILQLPFSHISNIMVLCFIKLKGRL